MNKILTMLLFFFTLSLSGCNDQQQPPDTNPPQKDAVCGTIKGLTCSAGQYCDFGPGQCQVADAQGTCKLQPTVCTKEFKPVCGCDGKTYGNACSAAAAGVNIDHEGQCAPPKPQACGGIAGIPCPDYQICVDDPSDTCDPNNGGADCPGFCQDK